MLLICPRFYVATGLAMQIMLRHVLRRGMTIKLGANITVIRVLLFQFRKRLCKSVCHGRSPFSKSPAYQPSSLVVGSGVQPMMMSTFTYYVPY
jgi:hypothetical protein